MLKKSYKLLLFLCLSLMFSLQVSAEDKLPNWAQQWVDWANSTGNTEYIDWAKRYSSPESIKAGKQWEEFLGYNAVDMVAKDAKAPRIKPGLVITKENAKEYEKELRELMPFGGDWQVDRLLPPEDAVYSDYLHYFPIEMEIVPTHHAWNDLGYLAATKKYNNKETCKLDEKGDLHGWIAGLPFPFPKNGQEVMHNYDRLTVMADNLNSFPCDFPLYGKTGKQERVEKIELRWRNYQGRIKVDPFPVIPGFEDIMEKGSIVALYPYDLKGFAAVRTRFADPTKEDGFVTYVPGMKRIRRLAGSNTQDPLVGSDLTWEDWKGFWTKTTIYPVEAKLLGEDIVLTQSFNLAPKAFEKDGFYTQRYWWERRPVWIVEIKHLDPTYIYSKRIWYVDKETFGIIQTFLFDQSDRLWKVFDICWRLSPETGELDYARGWIGDIINRHATNIAHTVTLNIPDMSENYFNLRYLSSRAH